MKGIAGLMGVVVICALGLAALRDPDEFWASAIFTLAFVIISVAAVAALVLEGRVRATWAGLAIVGWSCLLLWLLRPQLTLVKVAGAVGPRGNAIGTIEL